MVIGAPPESEPGLPGRRRAVTVFGGTGFLGHRVVRHLLDCSFRVRAVSRHPERVASRVGPDRVGWEAIGADVHDESSLTAAFGGAYGVVNTLSLYVERGGRETFRAVHVEAAARIARMARKARGEGEIVIHEAFPGATLFHPSSTMAGFPHCGHSDSLHPGKCPSMLDADGCSAAAIGGSASM